MKQFCWRSRAFSKPHWLMQSENIVLTSSSQEIFIYDHFFMCVNYVSDSLAALSLKGRSSCAGGNGDGGEQRPILQLPGAVPPLLDDTGDCTLILIFPRDQRAGGCVDHHHTVEDPYDLACKVFLSGDNPHSADTLRNFQYIKEGEELDMELYQADIRARFLEILGHSGIIVNQFPSLDKDEDFVTLSLPLEGPTIQFMAQRQGKCRKCRKAVILATVGMVYLLAYNFFLGLKPPRHFPCLLGMMTAPLTPPTTGPPPLVATPPVPKINHQRPTANEGTRTTG